MSTISLVLHRFVHLNHMPIHIFPAGILFLHEARGFLVDIRDRGACNAEGYRIPRTQIQIDDAAEICSRKLPLHRVRQLDWINLALDSNGVWTVGLIIPCYERAIDWFLPRLYAQGISGLPLNNKTVCRAALGFLEV